MKHIFYPQRVCSKKFLLEVDDESRRIVNFEFMGGCPGNLNGISRLLRGMHIDDVIERWADMPVCSSSKVSSCPAQIRLALLEVRALLNGEKIETHSAPVNPFSFFRQ